MSSQEIPVSFDDPFGNTMAKVLPVVKRGGRIVSRFDIKILPRGN